MKKTILSALIIFSMYLNGFSQKTKIGFQAGTSFSNMLLMDDWGTSISKLLPGFTAGVLVDFPLSSRFSFQPGLNFAQRGGKEKIDNFYYEESEMRLNYLEVPVNLIYHFKSAQHGFFLGYGFTIGFGISGKLNEHIEDFQGSFDTEEKIKFGNADEGNLRIIDLGLNMSTGYALKSGVFFSLTANLGLTSLTTDGRMTNNYFALKVGWLINRKS